MNELTNILVSIDPKTIYENINFSRQLFVEVKI